MNELLLQIPVIGMEVEQFLLLLITALAGGAFGAAIGALPAFIFTGFVVFLGEGLAILNRGIASSAASDVGYVSVTGVIASARLPARTSPSRAAWPPRRTPRKSTPR